MGCHPERSAESAKSKEPFLSGNYGFFDSLSPMLEVAQNDTGFYLSNLEQAPPYNKEYTNKEDILCL